MIDVSSYLGGNNQVFDYSTVPKKLRQLEILEFYKINSESNYFDLFS